VGWLNSDSAAYGLLEQFAHFVTQRARAVIVPTPGLEPLVRAHGARNVRILPGIVRAQDPDLLRRRLTRERLGIRDDHCVFLYLGAIGVANGLEMLLEAVESLPPQVRAQVVVAGDGSARRSFADAVTGKQLDRITLLPPVGQVEARDLLAAADVGLHLLRPDPLFASALPSKALEYLGAGLPFLTTVPGLPSEIAVDSGGAAVSSSAGLAAEFVSWSEASSEERERRSKQALRYGLAAFGLESSVALFEELLEDALDS
jgi:glycosyltransferase involved in cell wall biosynthesis